MRGFRFRQFIVYSFFLIILIAVAILGSGCGNPFSNHSEQLSFEDYTEQLFAAEAVTNTLSLHYTLTDPSRFGIDDYEVTLGHLSDSQHQTSLAALENVRAELSNYDYDSLDLANQLTYDILCDHIKQQLACGDYYLYEEPLHPQTGFTAEYPVLLVEYQFRTLRDVEDYLQLLACTPSYFDEIITLEEMKSAKGLFMSDSSADAVIAGCSALTAPCEEHYLITTFNDKLDKMESLDSAIRTQYKDKNRDLVQSKILPAYTGLATSLSRLKGTGQNEYGLCYLPEGKKYYSLLVYSSTGSPYSIEDLNGIIEDQREGDLIAIADLLQKDEDLAAETIASSCVFQDPEDTLQYLSDQIVDLFPVLPDTNYSVSYVDPCMQESMAPAFYLTSPIDDADHNRIYVNPASDYDDLKLFTTLAHEGFPGHLYQTAYTSHAGIAPIRSLLNYPGFVEGWATYVEFLSYSYAGLSTNAASLFAHHQSAILSLYASADLGIHYYGWTYKNTFDFFKEYGITDAQTVVDIYNYILEEPAHYLKYYVGYLEFLELREYAASRYGTNFSDTAFHEALLRIGPAPFAIVKKYLPLFYEN